LPVRLVRDRRHRLRIRSRTAEGRDQNGWWPASSSTTPADGELVVPRGDGAVAFEAVDRALHGVALLVVVLVEPGRSAAAGAEPVAVAELVGLLGDGALDPASAQVGPVRAGAVRFVRPDPVGLGTRSVRSCARHPDAFQDRLELGAVVPLAGGDQEGERLLSVLDSQVHLRGQSTARAPERVVGRLDTDATGRLLLEIPLPSSWPRNGAPGLRPRHDLSPQSIMIEKVVSPGAEGIGRPLIRGTSAEPEPGKAVSS